MCPSMKEAPHTSGPGLPRVREDLQEQQIGEDLMVYDARNHRVHILNGTAAAIYRMCDGEHDLDAMEREIRTLYHVAETQDVRQDILDTLALLGGKELFLQ